MNPIAVAIKGKGPFKFFQRVGAIGARYGLSPAKMEAHLEQFAEILEQYNCSATFPITASALARNNRSICKLQERGIEFAVHGFYHIDHSGLSLDEQLTHLEKARGAFEASGVTCEGFRGPYLRSGDATREALRRTGFKYDASQALVWDVSDGLENDSYRRVLDFYGSIEASNYPCLPRLENDLVNIPYCLPDDEALVERFGLSAGAMMSKPWLSILDRTYENGELFTLGLHPERIDLCAYPLGETVQRARQYSPGIWIARLDEIAHWWVERSKAAKTVTINDGDPPSLYIKGPVEIVWLTRAVDTSLAGIEWDGNFRLVRSKVLAYKSERRPWIGVSPASSSKLTDFLHQQGFIVEEAENNLLHSYFIDSPEFNNEDERPLLVKIEGGGFPLIRLARWPNGARSTLCITGDIDAMTLWDYGLRIIGR